MAQTRLRLGETLVEAGVLTQEVLEKALQIQKKRQLRLGTILLQEGFVSESQLVQALSLKLSIPWVSLWRIDIPDALLDLVPANVAEEFFLMPIYIRTTKEGERALYVAMNDPTDEDALKFVSAMAGLPVKPMIAGPSDIASAIRAYYYGEEDDTDPDAKPPSTPIALPASAVRPSGAMPPLPNAQGGTSAEPSGAPPALAPPVREEEIQEIEDDSLEEDQEDEEEAHEPPPARKPTEEAVEAPTLEKSPDAVDAEKEKTAPAPPAREQAPQADSSADKVFASKTQAQREAERRIYGVGGNKPTRGFSLTLLDGTTLSFGPPKKKQSAAVAAASGKLTKDDLLSGLKAAARGTPIEDFLPSDKWEAFVGAILKLLLNKHLIFHEELMKELEDFSKKK